MLQTQKYPTIFHSTLFESTQLTSEVNSKQHTANSKQHTANSKQQTPVHFARNNAGR